MPEQNFVLYLDPECCHCTRLDHAIGKGTKSEVGFDRVFVNASDPRVNGPFPHSYLVHDDHGEELVGNPVINMFAKHANLEIDVDVQTLDPTPADVVASQYTENF